MSQEHADSNSTLTPAVPFNLLPPIMEDSEASEVIEAHTITNKEKTATKISVSPASTTTDLAQGHGKVVLEQPVPPVVMDVKRKKQAEFELSKLIESRLGVEQQQNVELEQRVTVKKKEVTEEKNSEDHLKTVDGDADSVREEKIISENEPTVRMDVVREADAEDKDEYPEEGITKDLLSRFQKLAAEADNTKLKEHQPSGIARKPTGSLILRPRGQVDASHFVDIDDEGEASGGVFESQPIIRTDVVKENDRNEDEDLPPAGLTKALLSAFKEIGNSGENTPTVQRSRAGSSSSGKVHDHLLLVTNREQSCSENEPTVRENVVREMDTSKDLAELPARGVTKGLLTMFSQVSESAEKMKEKLHTPSGAARKRWTPKYKKVEESEKVEREIVKETMDVVSEEELPKRGQAGNLLKKFKSMETASTGNVYQHAWSADKRTKSEGSTDKIAGTEESGTAKEVNNSASLETKSTQNAKNIKADTQKDQESSTKLTSGCLQSDKSELVSKKPSNTLSK
ncbi:titin homolog [Watersipora subatra]|uniref:titin homolog n=1 Tax=Watersipora subatra TaxID=2589382 RepID=UPI00355B6F42